MKLKKFPLLNTKGFILKKDVYTTNLLFEHRKINFSTKNIIPFRNINPNPNDLNINEYLKINSCRKLHKVDSFLKPKIKKLTFPLHRIIPPSKSKIDFYPNFKGNKIIYIDDNSNGKKINFSIKNEENKKNFYENFNRNHNFTNRLLINISKLNKNKKDFGVNTFNEYNKGFNDFKTIKIKKLKIPENNNNKENKNNNNENTEQDLMFQTQIKFHNIYNNDNY